MIRRGNIVNFGGMTHSDPCWLHHGNASAWRALFQKGLEISAYTVQFDPVLGLWLGGGLALPCMPVWRSFRPQKGLHRVVFGPKSSVTN